MRIALLFEKKGAAKYISHLDLQRAFSRAVRRSGLPVKMSQGFNPHYAVSFASALATGIESEYEIAEFETKTDMPAPEFLRKISGALPPGLYAKDAARLIDGAPKLAAAVREAQYAVKIKKADADELKSAVCDIMNKDSLMVVRNGQETDIRKMIKELSFGGGIITMRLSAAPEGTLRPDTLVGELKKRADFTCGITRTGLYTYAHGGTRDLFGAFTQET